MVTVASCDGQDMNHRQIVSFIWGVADLIRDTFKRGKYRRDPAAHRAAPARLRAAPTKRKVLAVQARFKGRLQPRPAAPARLGVRPLQRVALRLREGCLLTPPTSRRTRATTSPGSAPTCARCRSSTSSRLDEAGLGSCSASATEGRPAPRRWSENAAMGTIFEELIRKFNEAFNENPGEHFTPRDVSTSSVHCSGGGHDGARHERTKGVVLRSSASSGGWRTSSATPS